jgi:hypothetical protein
MSTPGDPFEESRQRLVQQGGGFLRNTIREESVTCEICTTYAEGYKVCFRCQDYRKRLDLADQIGFVTYAWPSAQSGRAMYGYKESQPSRANQRVVQLMGVYAIRRHERCMADRAGDAPSHWAVVPSLKNRSAPHPLRQLLAPFVPQTEVTLAASDVTDPRGLNVNHFMVRTQVAGAHVLLVDDTWTTGGHLQSAAESAVLKPGSLRSAQSDQPHPDPPCRMPRCERRTRVRLSHPPPSCGCAD